MTMTYNDYRKIDAVHWTTLKAMRQSPMHYHHLAAHPIEDTAAMREGRAVHTAVLEPDRFPLDYAVWDGARRAGKGWEAFRDANQGRTILKRDEYEWCLDLRDAVRRHPVARHLLKVGEPEKTILWTDEATGLPCKGRVDWLNGIGLCDLKTAADLDPMRFGATAARLGYHCQLAFYRAGLRATGVEAPVKIMAVEKSPPYDVAVFTLDDDTLYAGEEEVGVLLRRVADCRAAGIWPGRYGDGETPLQLPGWAFAAFGEEPTGLGITIGGEET
jgi:exodeoxyribonuclease VIII